MEHPRASNAIRAWVRHARVSDVVPLYRIGHYLSVVTGDAGRSAFRLNVLNECGGYIQKEYVHDH